VARTVVAPDGERAVRDVVTPALRCTVRGCAEALSREGSTLRCPNGHAFDRSAAGYWNLLQPQDRRSTEAGDRAAAVAARRRWLSRGFTDGLIEEISARIAAAALPPGSTAVDVGCGEGTIASRLFARHRLDGCGVDLSVEAIKLAARADPGTTWVVANADRGLPLADASALLATSIFGRRPGAELHRVLASEGILVIAIPAADDLIELRRAAQGEGALRDRTPDAIAELAPWLTLKERSTWRATARHDREAWEDALAMTYRGARARERDRLSQVATVDVTLAAEILTLVPRVGVR
jgi:23S rRNA (guanine745-N1)-methyltransferase